MENAVDIIAKQCGLTEALTEIVWSYIHRLFHKQFSQDEYVMSNTEQEGESLRLAEQERNTKFQQAMAFIRSEGATSWQHDDRILLSCLVELGKEMFPTPQERLKYALRPVLTFLRENFRWTNKPSAYFAVLDQWGLKDNPAAVRRVLTHVAGRKLSNLSNFSKLAKEHLPEGERSIVFEKAVSQTGFLIPFSRYEERAQELADVAQEYVPQNRWPAAYALFKQSLLHTLTGKDRFKNKIAITNEGIEKVATMLSIFATHLPLSKKMRAQACEDILGLLDNPTEYVGGREVVAAGHYSSQSGLIRFNAKKNLNPALLRADDYPPVLEFLLDGERRGDFTKDASLLKDAAKYCLPAETQKETLLTDLLRVATATFEKSGYSNLGKFAGALAENFGEMNLSPEQKEVVLRWVECSAKQLSLKGRVDDSGILSAFEDVSHKLLTGEETLSWLGRLVEEPFLNPLPSQNEDNFPFLGFLEKQFRRVAGDDQSTHLSAGNVAAGYIRGGLVLAFAAATVIDPPEDQGVTILDSEFRNSFLSAAKMRDWVYGFSSVPYIRRAHLERYDALVNLVAQ